MTLTIRPVLSADTLTFLPPCATALLAALLFLPLSLRAEDNRTTLNLLLEPQEAGGYSYRKVNHDKTIHLMLYGLKDPAPTEIGATTPILKDRKALNAFFHQHWENIRQDYLGGNEATMRIVAGDESFASKPLNQNIGIDTAKMVGLTVPVGKWTVGGGYTWGEKNPAIMLQTTEGFFAGASYDAGRTGFQISYLTSGQEIMGLEVGGTDIQYSSIMIGTSFRVNNRMGLTATVQYRADDDPLTTGDRQTVFTVGTKWTF